MIVYCVSTIISVFISWFSTKIKITNVKTKYAVNFIQIISMIPLFCVAAFRYNVGTDYSYTYTQRFLWRIEGRDLSEIFEFGFIKLMDFIIFFTENSQWLFIITSFIFCLFTFKAIYQQSVNPYFSILLLVISSHFFANLNFVRNYIAYAIFIYSIKYIKRRKIFNYMLLIIFASLFHKTALLFVPIYFLYDLKLKPQFVIIIFICSVAFSSVFDRLFEYIISFTKYYWYYSSNDYNVDTQTSIIFINIIIIAIALFFYKNYGKDKVFYLYLNIQLITTIIAIFSSFLPMARRLILGFWFVQILSIPYFTQKIKNIYIKYAVNIGIILLLCVYTYRLIAVHGVYEVLPYQTIFNL